MFIEKLICLQELIVSKTSLCLSFQGDLLSCPKLNTRLSFQTGFMHVNACKSNASYDGLSMFLEVFIR